MVCETALQLPLWGGDVIYTLYSPLRHRRIMRASMFDDEALWLIREASGETPWQCRVTREASSKPSGFTSIPLTSVDKEAGKGQSALYLLFRPGFRFELRKTGGRCSESQSKYGRDAPKLTPLNSTFMKSHRKSPLWSRCSRSADGGEFFEGPVSLLLQS